MRRNRLALTCRNQDCSSSVSRGMDPAVASAAKLISIQLPRTRPDRSFSTLQALKRSSESDEDCCWTALALNVGTWWLTQILAEEAALDYDKRVFAKMFRHVLLVGDPYLNRAARLSGARTLFTSMPKEANIIWLYSCMVAAVLIIFSAFTLSSHQNHWKRETTS